MPSPNAAADFAREVVQRLRAAGFTAFWAGGCVRDQLLGHPPKDYDVATNATPEQVRDLFGRRRTLFIGAAFGVVTVIGPRAAGPLEVATFRRDGGYSDGRHPDHVSFSSAEEDAQRRDFTINGLFFDPLSDEVIDYVGGRDDLARRVIRAIGDPDLRFQEDKLRMVRAIRFATTLGFAIDADTQAAITRRADEVAQVSAERITAEMRRILLHPRATLGLRLARETGLWRTILPDYAQADPATGEHDWRLMLALFDQLSGPRESSLALAALLWPLAHRVGERAIVAPLVERWRLTNLEAKQTSWLLAHVTAVQHAPSLPWPRLQPVLIHPQVEPLIELTRAVIHATQGAHASLEALQYCAERLAWPRDRLNPQPLLNGHDLQQAGVPAGPELGRWLQAVRSAQLDGLIHSHGAAIEWVQSRRRQEEGPERPAT